MSSSCRRGSNSRSGSHHDSIAPDSRPLSATSSGVPSPAPSRRTGPSDPSTSRDEGHRAVIWRQAHVDRSAGPTAAASEMRHEPKTAGTSWTLLTCVPHRRHGRREKRPWQAGDCRAARSVLPSRWQGLFGTSAAANQGCRRKRGWHAHRRSRQGSLRCRGPK